MHAPTERHGLTVSALEGGHEAAVPRRGRGRRGQSVPLGRLGGPSSFSSSPAVPFDLEGDLVALQVDRLQHRSALHLHRRVVLKTQRQNLML